METKALTELSETRNNDCKSESNVARDSGFKCCVIELTDKEVLSRQDQPNESISINADAEAEISKNEILISKDLNQSSSVPQVAVEFNGSSIGKRKRDDENETHDNSISSVKKARTTIDEDEPTVHVKYGSLPRKSKEKLEELLQQWSEWHCQHYPPTHDSKEILESGEGTYFPALRVGDDNSSAVRFWMNNPLTDQLNREYVSVDSKTAPLYDRGYSLEGDSKKLDAFRCFNCGSYSHSLNECPKPRDNVAISNARTLHQPNYNKKSSISRTPTRYYQNSPAGKYDGLIPGVLQAETRRLLGLGELDPPPWLHRMREIGYPPGYLDLEDDNDLPSGITIFADGEENENNEKAVETDSPQPRARKMSVQFPGINALIPENADQRKWIMQPSSLDLPRTPPFPYPAPFSFSSPMYASQNNYYYSSSNLSAFPMPGSPLAYGGSLYSSSPLSPAYNIPRNDAHFDYRRFSYERRYY